MAEVKFSEDHEILRLLRNQDTSDKGFRLLMGTYKERLYYHIRQMVGNHEDADDVLQNVFIEVYRNVQNFQEKSSLFTWLYRIATNEALNFLNSNKTKQTVALDEVAFNITNNGSEEFQDENEIQMKLLQAVNILPDKQKQVFNLRYNEEMSYEEISQILETSVGALKASYHHAVKKIESYIKGTI